MEMNRRERARRQAGFSLVEAMIAAGLFLVIVIGVMPMFTRAAVNNTSGKESTEASNHARSRAEEYLELDFNGPELTITGGSERVDTDYFNPGSERWDPTMPSERPTWTRTTTIRQYGVAALADGVLDRAEALPGGTDFSQIHFKEIEVTVQGNRDSGPLGPPKNITIRVLKSQ